jgi:hypothetical protein
LDFLTSGGKRLQAKPNIQGIYSVSYTGPLGSGIALLLFWNGAVQGADIAGATYDGSYQMVNSNEISCLLEMSIPANTYLVSGAPVSDKPYKILFPITLPFDMTEKEFVRLELPIGTVNAIFRKLKSIEM